jgi:hypothetical protein
LLGELFNMWTPKLIVAQIGDPKLGTLNWNSISKILQKFTSCSYDAGNVQNLYWYNKSFKVVELHKIIQSLRPNVKEPDPSSHTKVVRMLYDNRKWIFDGEDDSYNDWEMRCSNNYTDFDYTPPKFTVRNPELRHPSVIGSYGQLDVKVLPELSEQYYNYPHVTG